LELWLPGPTRRKAGSRENPASPPLLEHVASVFFGDIETKFVLCSMNSPNHSNKEADKPTSARRRTKFRPHTGAVFPPTRWSQVVLAGDASEEVRREALRQLCEYYHETIYAFVRRGLKTDPAEALAVTNGFVEELLRIAPLIAFVPERGKSG